MGIDGVTVLPSSAIVLLSFLAIVRAVVGFKSLDAAEPFHVSGMDRLGWPCGVLIHSCLRHQILIMHAYLQSYLHIQYI